MKKILLLFSILCFIAFHSEAQLINWQTGNGDPCAGTGNGTANATTDAACITVNDLCRGTGINQGSGGDFNSNGFDTSNGSCGDAIADDDCLTWSFDLAAGCSVVAESEIEFQLDRSGTGPPNYCLDVEIGTGNGFNNISTGTISSNTGCVNAQVSATEITGPTTVTFRLCAWGASGGSGTMDIEDGIASCGGAEGGISLTEPGPAPISLASFSAKPMDNSSVDLNWITSSEENNEYFNIEHSTNGRDFVAIDQVAGALNSTEMRYYNYTHEDAVVGMNYYRLRQVDTDGTYSFSEVEAVRIGQKTKIEVMPTLAESTIQVSIAEGLDKEAVVEVYNVLGRLVSTEVLGQGDTQLSIDVANLQAGHYFVRLNNGQTADITRFIKK